MESEDFENLLKKKQTELDLCMKEMERLRMETDLQKKRVDEASHYELLASYIYVFIICFFLSKIYGLILTIFFCYWFILTIIFLLCEVAGDV